MAKRPRKPRESTIAKRFSNAKTVTCLKNKIDVDVTHNDDYEFSKVTNSYTSVGGGVTFWKDGTYATIVNLIDPSKKCKCTNCNCNK